MARSPARKQSFPRIRNFQQGQFTLQGRIERDADTHWRIPRREMIRQRGHLVSARLADGSRDRYIDPIDRHAVAITQPVAPSPLYRLTISGVRSILTLDEDERDTLTDSGYIWRIVGHAYADGDAETGLVPFYELFSSGNNDHLYLNDAAEIASALAMDYVNEGVAFFAFLADGGVNRLPVYRTVAGMSHWYSSDFAEYSLAPADWVREGEQFWLLANAERTIS